jgi:transposase
MSAKAKAVRRKPSSRELRSRAVTADEQRDGSRRRLAKTLWMRLRGVRDRITREREPGRLAPKPHGGGSPADGEQRRLAVVPPRGQRAPEATLRELGPRVHEASPVSVRVAPMSRALARLQLPRQETVSRHGARARRRPKTTGRRRRRESAQCPQGAGRCGRIRQHPSEGEGLCPRSPRATRPWRQAAASRPPCHHGRGVGREGGVAAMRLQGFRGGAAFLVLVPEGWAARRRPGQVVVRDNLKAHQGAGVPPAITAVLAGGLPERGMLVHSGHDLAHKPPCGTTGAGDRRRLCGDHEPGCERLVCSRWLSHWIHMKNAVSWGADRAYDTNAGTSVLPLGRRPNGQSVGVPRMP